MDKHQELIDKVNKFKKDMKVPQGMGIVSEEILLEMVKEGKPLIYNKTRPLKYSGEIYQKGDPIILGDGIYDYDRTMIKNGLFSVPGDAGKFEAQKALQDKYRDEIQPLELRLLAQLQFVLREEQAVLDFTRRLKDAKAKVKSRKANIETAYINLAGCFIDDTGTSTS